MLVTATQCMANESILCDPAIYRTNANTGLILQPADALIDPIVRLKLELAGYTLSDASTLRLVTVDRTDTTEDDWHGTKVEQGPTVAGLSPADQGAAAASLGLTGVIRSTLIITKTSNFDPVKFELVVEMFSLPEGAPLWTVRCSEPFEDFEGTSRLLASCAGDGVLAWRAPDAVIGRQP